MYNVRVPLLPGMHNEMLEPIGIESCGILWVEHWITAPDIEALAVATAVLDKLLTCRSSYLSYILKHKWITMP